MTYCLFCNQPNEMKVNWQTALGINNQTKLCKNCCDSLEMIKGEICKICNRPLSQVSLSYKKDNHCLDCIKWEQDPKWQGALTRNHSVYSYNNFLKEVLALFKFRGDYKIIEAFTPIFSPLSSQYKDYLITPIPLSKERLYERGFNQAEAIGKLLSSTSKLHPFLSRTHSEKQSKKTRAERIDSQNPFKALEPSIIKNKKILLVDDIYTTGTTLRQAARICHFYGADEVSSFTLAR